MAFPANEKDLEVSVAYGANLASSLPGLTYSANLAPTLVRPRLTITRGRIAGATRTQPTSIAFELKNPAGIFSPRNISGPNYGRLRRNTPVRVRLDAGSGLVTRGIAYMPDWPTRWTGPDIDDRIPMQASGALRRLGTGQDSKSALRRTILASSPVAYWPLEDAAGSTQAAAGISGGTPMTYTAGAFATIAGPAGAAAALDVSAGPTLGAPTFVSSATSWRVEFVAKIPPLVLNQEAPLVQIVTPTGVCRVFASDGLSWSAYFTDNNGANFQIPDSTVVSDNQWHHFAVTFAQSGGSTFVQVFLAGVLKSSGTFAFPFSSITRLDINQKDAFFGPPTPTSAIGHVGVWAPNPGVLNTAAAMNGYPSELAATRVARLCTEEGVTVNVTAGVSEPMGPQLPGTIVDLLRECEDTDEGTLIERRTGELGFDPRSSRYNKAVAMTVDYVRQIADLIPDDDDRDLVNYVTVTRIGGSSATYERTDSPLGTDKATGVDRYPGGPFNRSLGTDSQAIQHASYIAYRGTVDEPRYVIVINLVAEPALITQWLACDIGSRILVNNPPSIQVGPAPLDLVIEGYTELLDGVEWNVTIYATPYRINEVLQIETGTGNRSRIPAGVSTLDADQAAGATSFLVATPTVKWIDSVGYAAQFPVVIEIAGEAMTCTGIVNYLNANPYFETTAAPWTAFGGTVARSTAQFHQGVAALLLTPDGIQAFPDARSELVPGVTAGAAYQAQAWVRCVSSRNVTINILWRDAGGAVISTSTVTVAVTAATWTLLTVSATAPALTTQAQVTLSMASTPPVTDLLYVDEAMLIDPLRQVFTVQRGLHGVSKALPSGSAVQLWRPPRIAL